MRLFGSVFIFTVLVLCCAAQQSTGTSPHKILDMSLRLFTAEEAAQTGARCLDGSPAGYYIQPSESISKRQYKWVIFLDGGGFCNDANSCSIRTHESLGTSRKFTQAAGPQNILIDSVSYSQYVGWNRVRVPYCSGDFFTGQVRTPSNSTFGYYFAGHLILQAVFEDLSKNHNLRNASEIILVGSSSGGFGVLMNVDSLRFLVPPTTRVVGFVQAGFFLEFMPYGPWTQMQTAANSATREKMEVDAWSNRQLAIDYPVLYNLYKAYVPRYCASNSPDPSACMSPSRAYAYVSTRLFVAQNLEDAAQIFHFGGAPMPAYGSTIPDDIASYVEYFRGLMTAHLGSVLSSSKNDGLFAPSCLKHSFFEHPFEYMRGVDMVKAFQIWYEGQDSKVQLMDECTTISCNAGCPFFGPHAQPSLFPNSADNNDGERDDIPDSADSSEGIIVGKDYKSSSSSSSASTSTQTDIKSGLSFSAGAGASVQEDMNADSAISLHDPVVSDEVQSELARVSSEDEDAAVYALDAASVTHKAPAQQKQQHVKHAHSTVATPVVQSQHKKRTKAARKSS